ncbi:iron-containing redox enzyme family protein [Streptomyces sp. RerS4]|uniref:iron-containing redox enzyme family protein n=1 Tax=Streptomyces sp. RerS4 TaxID=2942449 RepID=UPI00201C8CB8|nr:iron-containing redox enzyme family protein [Streptomyces sp. RerS4]UQX04437.1 iron-containing redox enzyme family protein [Streptomyces sp. RerS4]
MSVPPTAAEAAWHTAPRGPVSEAVATALLNHTPPPAAPCAEAADAADPWGEDLHLALYLLYELHYRGLPGVADDREWDPALLGLRAALEQRFVTALEDALPCDRTVAEAFAPLLVETAGGAGGISAALVAGGTLRQVREYAVLRSPYQLKEADPQAWGIPRLTGRAKAAFVAVEYDEFGAGHPEAIHARLFADLMVDLGLDPAYNHYLGHVPAPALATVNLMSLFGLHRAWRGALVGHFACVETTSSPGSKRMVRALTACGAGPAAIRFYAEHVTADAVHEQVVRHEVVGGLLEEEPDLEPQVAFGCDATVLLEARLAEHVLTAWNRNETALRRPLPEGPEEGAGHSSG